jgi:ankyrin repeat protein
VLLAWLLMAACAQETDLQWASYRDDLPAAERLLREGADVNAATDLGVTALWAAAQNGSLPMVRRLLEAGANPNLALLAGETPLMVAARAGYADVVEALLNKGANPNARGAREQTALMWAAAQKHPAVVKALLAHGADVHAKSAEWTDMMAVPPHGYPGYNRQIPHGADTALMFAARVGDLESAKLLLAAGANVNDRDAWGVSALVLAAHSGYRDLVEFFLAKGADASSAEAGFTALHIAILRRDEAMARMLLAAGANPNEPVRTWTPTRRSSKDFHFMPALVGASPLWLAARFTEPEVMRLLMKHGADPKFVHHSDVVAEKGFKHKKESATVLMAAVGMGGGSAWVKAPAGQQQALMLESVKLAVEWGVDVNAVNTDGQTALDAARAAGYERVVQFLEGRR